MEHLPIKIYLDVCYQNCMLFVLCALCSDADEPVADGKLAVLCSSQCIRIYDPERIVRTCTIDSVYFRYY